MSVCPVLVGREAEMKVLEGLLEGGGVVLVAGEAGVGKSRLVRDFAARAADRGHLVVWGRPEAVTRPGPYSLMLDLLEDVASVIRTGEADARELIDALSAGGEEQPARPIAARVRGLLSNLGRAPVVVFEDLHASDEPSHAVLAHLARSARDDGMILIGTYRTEERAGEGLQRLLDLLTRDRIATELELAVLSREAVEEMLRAMWEAEPKPEEVEAIQRLGEGIPFFVEELAAARESLSDPSVPATIARTVEARFASLDDAGRAVIRAASLTDGAIDPAVLAEVAELAESDVPRVLVDAVRAGLLEDREGRLVFRHALVREAIAEGIVSVERAGLHRALAAAIERIHADQLEPHALALARHHAGAGDHDGAAPHWLTAGRRAMSAGALEEARAAFTSCLDAGGGEALHATVGLGEVALRTHDSEGALRLLRSAADGFLDRGMKADAARALSRAAHVMELGSQPDVGIVALQEQASSLAEEDGDGALIARLLIERGYTLTRSIVGAGDGEPLLRHGLERAEALGDVGLQADAHEGLAWVAEQSGDEHGAENHGKRACALAVEGRKDDLIFKTHANHAMRLALSGRCAESLEYLEVARENLLRGVGSFHLARLEHSRLWLLWRMGDPSEADRVAGRLEATEMAQVYGRVVRVWAAMLRGDRSTARAILDAWWEDVGGAGVREAALTDPIAWDGPPYPGLAEHLFRALDDADLPSEAAGQADAYLEMCWSGHSDIPAMAGTLCARIKLRAGLVAEAAEVLDRVDEHLKGRTYPLRSAEVAEIRGAIALAGGKHERALDLLDQAAGLFAGCDNVVDRARTLRLKAEAALATGEERDTVGVILREARELASSVEAAVEVNRIEAQMRAIGMRPRAGRPRGPRRPPGSLSAREEEVAALVAAGASNAEIGAKLFISERTVQDHIANAQRRIDVNGRAGLAAWAAKHGLV